MSSRYVLFSLALVLAGGLASASVLWDGDAAKGTSVFGASIGTECPTCCEVTTPTDSGVGGIKVFKFLCHDNGSTKTRCEGSRMRDFAPTNTGTYYFGWKQKWGPLPTLAGKWQVLEQVHLGGTGATGGPVPFGIQVPADGLMHFQYEDPAGTPMDFWTHSLPLNSWHQFTYHIKMSETEADGWVELWYDGIMQTLANGGTRFPSAWARPDSDSYWKWGVYRSGTGGPIGDSVAYLAKAKAGTTYADVDSSTQPTPTPVPGATPTPTPVPGGSFSGYYKIIGQQSGKALVVASASTASSASVILYDYNDNATDNDEWQVLSIGSGFYRVIARHSGKDLTVASASTGGGASIIQYTYGGTSTNDEWQMVDAGSGYYEIKNRNSGKLVQAMGTTNSSAIQQQTDDNGTDQRFQLISIP